MSKLNAGAFEFVPGKGFGAPRAPPLPPPPEPVDRPQQTEAPPPAPTITLNIGGSKPNPTPPRVPSSQPSAAVTPTSKPPAVSSQTSSQVPNATAPLSKTFTTAKAKTDTVAIAQEVHAVADQAVVKDLFGDGELDERN